MRERERERVLRSYGGQRTHSLSNARPPQAAIFIIILHTFQLFYFVFDRKGKRPTWPLNLRPSACERAERSMPKRKQTETGGGSAGTTSVDNPLSSARRQKHSSTSKANLTAQSLWHRKSGAGYALFVSYYGEQPLGVVVDGTEGEDLSKTDTLKSHARGSGQSRAAKRRKKRKKSLPSAAAKMGEESPPAYEACFQSRPFLRSVDVSHQLVHAYKSTRGDYAHLAPYVATLSTPLPLTFRLREENFSSSSQRTNTIDYLRKSYSDLILPASYDPTQCIYQSTPQSNMSKSNLYKLSPALKDLLVERSKDGTLARQELGSMLPVQALSAGGWLVPGSRVLDLCASPGSKTLQALEIAATTSHPGSCGRGRVVANDVHSGRLESLRDDIGRSGVDEALASRVTYTNFDASEFPYPRSGRLFDAVIADVPCSGDGTIRKDRHILPLWTPATGNALHRLQVKILVRALQLVRVGGLVCYSTCSLNPVEDEAVVAAALKLLQRKEGVADDGAPSAELVNWPAKLMPDLIRRAGVSRWKIADYSDDSEGNDDFGSLTWYSGFEEARKGNMAHAERTMWHESEGRGNDGDPLNLERCSRLWPQDQDTGGFFVALIRKN